MHRQKLGIAADLVSHHAESLDADAPVILVRIVAWVEMERLAHVISCQAGTAIGDHEGDAAQGMAGHEPVHFPIQVCDAHLVQAHCARARRAQVKVRNESQRCRDVEGLADPHDRTRGEELLVRMDMARGPRHRRA